MSLINDYIDKGASGQFLVQPGGGKIHVSRHVLAGFYQYPTNQVLGAAPLMGGHYITITIVLANCLLQVEKVPAAGVSFVTQHNARPLPVTHSAGATVSKQVNIYIFRAQQKSVITRFCQRLLPLLRAGHADWFYHFDFPWFRPGAAAKLLPHGSELSILHSQTSRQFSCWIKIFIICCIPPYKNSPA